MLFTDLSQWQSGQKSVTSKLVARETNTQTNGKNVPLLRTRPHKECTAAIAHERQRAQQQQRALIAPALGAASCTLRAAPCPEARTC